MNESNKRKRLFCFGYGYTCDYLGHILKQQAGQRWTLSGTTRDSEKRKSLLLRRIRAHIFDYECPLPDPYLVLKDVTHLLISTPPGDAGDPSFLVHGDDLAHLPNLEWIGYLSTTAVYGDRGGRQVDETSEIQPTSRRGTRRAVAEEQWLSLYHSHGLPVHIFRLSGIYGPGSSALDSVRAGMARRIDKPGQVFNRVHVEDIAQALSASFARPNPGSIYNLADDNPEPSHEVIKYACELLGKEPPPCIPYEEVDMAPIARSFYEDNKFILNNKIKNELGITLKYPNFRKGLEGCLEAEKHALHAFRQATY